jgi:hypothetical protein
MSTNYNKSTDKISSRNADQTKKSDQSKPLSAEGAEKSVHKPITMADLMKIVEQKRKEKALQKMNEGPQEEKEVRKQLGKSPTDFIQMKNDIQKTTKKLVVSNVPQVGAQKNVSKSTPTMKKMPIDEHIGDILAKHNAGKHDDGKENALYIQSPTGTGKSIRVPMALVDDPNTKGQVFVAMPNVMPAKSSCEFVGEFCPEGYVGYDCGGKKEYTKDTKLVYVTKGYLVQYLLSHFRNRTLPTNLDTIMLDEAHDETLDSMMILWLVMLLKTKMKINLVIASATSEASHFVEMFPKMESVIVQPASHEVTMQFHHKNFSVDRDRKELLQTMVHVLKNNHRKQKKQQGDVLIIMPGQNDINSLKEMLDKDRTFNCLVLPAFSSQGSEENEKILVPCPDEYDYKIIIGTSIVQQSLTIEGITFCLDSGIEKEKHVDSNGVSSLDEVTCSKSTVFQRKGRVGRTQPGNYYFMGTEELFDSLQPLPIPEVHRTPLYMQILQLVGAHLNPVEVMFGITSYQIERDIQHMINENLLISTDDDKLEVTEQGEFVQNFPVCGIEGGKLMFHALKTADEHKLNKIDKDIFITTSVFFAVYIEIQGLIFWLPDGNRIPDKIKLAEEIDVIKKTVHSKFKRFDCFSTAFNVFSNMMDDCTGANSLQNKHVRYEWYSTNAIYSKTLEDLRSGFIKTFDRIKKLVDVSPNWTCYEVQHRVLFEKIFETVFPRKIFSHANSSKFHYTNSEDNDYKVDNRVIGTITRQPIIIAMSTRRVKDLELISKMFLLTEKCKELEMDAKKQQALKESIARTTGLNNESVTRNISKAASSNTGYNSDSDSSSCGAWMHFG